MRSETKIARGDRGRRDAGGPAGGGAQLLAEWPGRAAGPRRSWISRPGAAWRWRKARIARSVATLDELAARGVDSCRASQHRCAAPGDVRHHAGQGDCRSSPPTAARCAPTSEPSARAAQGDLPPSALQPDSDVLARGRAASASVRNSGSGCAGPAPASANGLAALIPAELFVPQVSSRGGPLSFHSPHDDPRRHVDRRGRARRQIAADADGHVTGIARIQPLWAQTSTSRCRGKASR